MTAVTASSRSSTMSSSIPRPRTPTTTSSGVVEAHEDSNGQSASAVSFALPQATSKECDPRFLQNHLTQLAYGEIRFNTCFKIVDSSQPVAPDTSDPLQATDSPGASSSIPATAAGSPQTTVDAEVQRLLTEIQAVTTNESILYPLVCELLTLLSKAVYSRIDPAEQLVWRTRHKIREDVDGHIVFIDHHTSAPTHFPDRAYSPKDAPDIIGVVNAGDFKCTAYQVYSGVPYHRVEAVVEAKSAKKDGRAQAVSYAFRHQQARPDHPAFYCLSVNPNTYQIVLSDPTGVVASEKIEWQDDLDHLVSYLYSHYCPPTAHVLHDDTLAWTAGSGRKTHPVWTIECNGKTYTNGKHLFTGDPWGRRTAVFEVNPPPEVAENKAAIKESYRHYKRRFKEEVLLERIHKDGDILGFVRMLDHESVPVKNGGIVQCGTEEADTLRTKERLVLKDLGYHLMCAKSVHDLLKVIYDALEVHRAVLMRRRVLHRDMSIYNILIYPQYGRIDRVVDHAPFYIADVLDQKRPPEERRSAALVIDADNAADLSAEGNDSTEELKKCTGTPMFIARSVSKGSFLCTLDTLLKFAMPKLNGAARTKYVDTYGRERYERYEEKPGTFHGAQPPPQSYWELAAERSDELDTNLPPFRHRPEHDVESIWWTLLAALIRVYPVGAIEDEAANKALKSVWLQLVAHNVPEDQETPDPRSPLLIRSRKTWEKIFLKEMQGKGLGDLLTSIACQVCPEYGLWATPPVEDHLHEAVQRIILQYLVDHANNDIPLDPDRRRTTTDVIPEHATLSPETTKGTKKSEKQSTQAHIHIATADPQSAVSSPPLSRAGRTRDGAAAAAGSSSHDAAPRVTRQSSKRGSENQGGRKPKRAKRLSDSDSRILYDDQDHDS